MDRDLVIRAQQGDRDAFATLARSYGDGMFTLAERILRDPDRADDAFQQALVAMWRDLPRLRDVDRFEGWLRRILIRCCYTEIRQAGRRSVVSLPLIGEPAHLDAGQIAVDERDRLERGFRRLPLDQRTVLALHHYAGLSTADIAETLGIPVGTARSRLHYAHRAMRAALDAVERAAVSGGSVS